MMWEVFFLLEMMSCCCQKHSTNGHGYKLVQNLGMDLPNSWVSPIWCVLVGTPILRHNRYTLSRHFSDELSH